MKAIAIDFTDTNTASDLVGTTGNPKTECMLRAQISGWPTAIEEFVNAEIKGPDEFIIVMQALNSIFMSSLASIAARGLIQGGEPALNGQIGARVMTGLVNPSDLTWPQRRALGLLGKYRNFTRVKNGYRVSGTKLSVSLKMIRKLEDHHLVRQFVRHGRQTVTVTSSGRFCLEVMQERGTRH